MPANHHDVLIIGSGTSAYYCARTLLDAGRKVAIVDERPFGGTCALRGCQPKKYLVANAEAAAMAAHLAGRGISGRPAVDWQALQALKNEFLAGRPEAEVADWQAAGALPIAGRARMTDPDSVTVDGTRHTADSIVLATGATPSRADIPGSEWIAISDDFLELPELPERILFLGGGYISFEFAFVAATAGAEVTVLQRSDKPLKAFDCDIVQVVLGAARDAGINVCTGETLAWVEKRDGALCARGSSGDDYRADMIIEATGRRPNLSVLEDGAGGVDHGPRGVKVNAHLQSVSNPRVYAVGDCADTPYMLAPVADAEGAAAARNILEGNSVEPDYSVVPSAVFTLPPIGSVGLSEPAARERGLDFRVNFRTGLGWPSSKRIGERHSGYKVLIENGSDRILGAHIARHNASEVVNVFALAMKHGIPAGELAEFPWAYPTMTSDLKYMVR